MYCMFLMTIKNELYVKYLVYGNHIIHLMTR